MSHVVAEDLLALVGPGRILHYGCRDTSLIAALLQKGCDARGQLIDQDADKPLDQDRIFCSANADIAVSFDTVLVDPSITARTKDFKTLLTSLRGLTEQTLVLGFFNAASTPMDSGPTALDTREIEMAAVASGYRRHPACFPVSRYQRLNDPAPEPLLCFEKVPDDVLSRWPLDFLLANRDLHMDMSREASPRSDAHLVRYALAADWIRPGDTVLDCACGLGYGTAVLAASSRGRRFIGVDIDADSVSYAKDNFAGYPVEYRVGSATDLGFLPDRSVDMVVSFETIEHLADYETFVDEIARILKPDGRVFGSVPHLWVDETGRDPNPHHFHAFDYARIRDSFSRHFIVEARYGQTAPGGVKLTDAPRQIDQRPLKSNVGEADTEWWIVIAAADPSRSTEADYRHPEFDSCTAGTQANLTDFAAHYDNPWIYRQLIQNGQRIRDPEVLAASIDSAASQADRASADFGAMLTVRSYKALQDHDSSAHAELLPSIDVYLALRCDNPHIHRWQISLSYVAALLALDSGQRDRGKALLEGAVGLDPLRFSPLISTKTIASYFLLGTMQLVDGQPEPARASFAAGVESARRALHAPDENAIGHPDRPLAFGFFELAEIADMAGQCATAIQEMDRFASAPGVFWRSIDAKRFGLFTWIKNQGVELERLREEMQRLRADLDKQHRQSTLRVLVPKRFMEVFLELLPALARRVWNGVTPGIRHSSQPAKRR